jgi:hypothetical protein
MLALRALGASLVISVVLRAQTDGNGTVVFQNRVSYFCDRRAAFPPQGLEQIGMGDLLAGQSLRTDLSVADQDARSTVKKSLGFFALPGDVADQLTETEQGRCDNHTARDRFVVGHQGVLHRFTQDQQDDEVERGHLAHVLLAEHSKENENEHIDQRGPHHEFADGNARGKHRSSPVEMTAFTCAASHRAAVLSPLIFCRDASGRGTSGDNVHPDHQFRADRRRRRLWSRGELVTLEQDATQKNRQISRAFAERGAK